MRQQLNLSAFDYSFTLAMSYVAGITVDQGRELANMIEAAKERGENSSVWHQSSILFGHSCNCAKCHPNKGAFSYRHVA